MKNNGIVKCFLAAFLTAALFAVFAPQQHVGAASASVANTSKVTYGSKVYYGSYDYTYTKHIEIYSNNKSGTNEKLLTYMNCSDTQLLWQVCVYTVYNNKLYFSVSWEKEGLGIGNLYSLSLKSKKITLIQEDFYPASYSGKCGRYLYGTDVNSTCIRVFDCAKGKVIRTVKNAGAFGNIFASISGDHLYYIRRASSTRTYVYRVSLTGTGKEKIFTLKGNYWNYEIGTISSSKIYYRVRNDDRTYSYYVYKIKTKKTTQITEAKAGEQTWR